MEILTCQQCFSEFEWLVQGIGKPKLYCPPCTSARLKAQKDRYAQSDRGKQASREATKRWVSSDKGKAYIKEWDANGVKAAASHTALPQDR